MNNAGIGLQGTSWGGLDNWHKIFDVNVFGCVACLSVPTLDVFKPCRVVNVQQTFAPVRGLFLARESD
jgi:NAD(P)-dependent dehydrogenase (short-subunit alcohol dehydrogenase family)